MSKIDELLKNEKVEWKKLGDVCEIIGGSSFPKSFQGKNSGKYAFYKVSDMNKCTVLMNNSENYIDDDDLKKLKAKLIPKNSLIFPKVGATLATNKKRLLIKESCIDNNILALVAKEIHYKYLYHIFAKEQLLSFANGKGAVPSIDMEKLKNFKIPIPSIETQEKIVKTLDKFTNYVTELQAELQARTKQYEYYRDMLLSEEYLNKLSYYLEENRLLKLEWKTLDEISVGSLSYGSGASAIDYDGETRYIRITDINDSGGLNKEKASPNVVEEKYILNNEDILFARSGATVGKNYIHLINDKCVYAGYLIRLIVNKEIALPKFVFYCLNTNRYKIFVDNTKSRGSQPNINAKQYGSFKIPIIPIEIQNIVVEILDKFQSLLADTKGLLPQEIEQRQKQYEYYREKLLTFDENSAKRESISL